MIEAAPACARNVGYHAVHHLPALLVRVEILIEKVPEKAPALRYAHGISSLHRSCGLRIIFQIGKKIAHGRQSHACHYRIFSRVDQFVNLAGLKATLQLDKPAFVSKAPFFARNRLARTIRRVTSGKDIQRARWIVYGVTLPAIWAKLEMSQWHLIPLFRWREI